MRKLCSWQRAVAGVVFCLVFSAGNATAAPVWFKFYDMNKQGPSAVVDGGMQSFRTGGVTVTVSSQRPGNAPDPAKALIRGNRETVGSLGVGPQQRPRSETPDKRVANDAVSRGESLFLSFDREVTLIATVSFDVDGGYTQFQGPPSGRSYQVLRLVGESGVHVGDVNPVSRPLEVSRRPPGTAPFPSAENAHFLQQNGAETGPPILAPIGVQEGQTLRGQLFELKNPERASAEFRWFLGGVAADVQPIPEPSTALLTGAGLFALGFAGARARRRRRAAGF